MTDKRVVIIGAGLGGLCAAIKLREAGVQHVLVLDRNPRVGGVWHENTYPGCACDVPVILYQFSFAPSMSWSRQFPSSAEVQHYAEELVDTFQLGPHLRLGLAATRAEWLEDRGVWHITLDDGTIIEADAVVGALGQLNRPSWPDIQGRDDFAGASMHSARWDHSVCLKGKKVGVIGSAASAVQLIPEVAKEAGHLSVYQRTPNWVIPRNDELITQEQLALALTVPEKALELNEMNRRIVYENADYFFWQAFSWTPEGRAAYTRIAMDHLEAQVPDAALRKKLTPDYPIGCKRILICDDFYPTLMMDHVDLVTDGIARIRENGVETRDGRLHDHDVLVYATGFETTGWHWSVDVIGRFGQSLIQRWAEAPEAYMGITVTDYPNLFVLYGPNTNLGHNSITFMLERQVDYVVKALQALERTGAKAMAPSAAAQTRFNTQLQKDLAKTVWADPHCASWYKDSKGRITQNWSSHTRAYADATAEVKLEDYEIIR
ncbi:MAG: flavin-containing monooxygenase [Alphaproteobacteria bacterium]